MAEERKGYRYKEESPEQKNRFWASADDYVFYDAEPLTEAEKALVAEIWDELTQGRATLESKVTKEYALDSAKK